MSKNLFGRPQKNGKQKQKWTNMGFHETKNFTKKRKYWLDEEINYWVGEDIFKDIWQDVDIQQKRQNKKF
jgi:hypothetical protein